MLSIAEAIEDNRFTLIRLPVSCFGKVDNESKQNDAAPQEGEYQPAADADPGVNAPLDGWISFAVFQAHDAKHECRYPKR